MAILILSVIYRFRIFGRSESDARPILIEMKNTNEAMRHLLIFDLCPYDFMHFYILWEEVYTSSTAP